LAEDLLVYGGSQRFLRLQAREGAAADGEQRNAGDARFLISMAEKFLVPLRVS
jgi:hypothetical protein